MGVDIKPYELAVDRLFRQIDHRGASPPRAVIVDREDLALALNFVRMLQGQCARHADATPA